MLTRHIIREAIGQHIEWLGLFGPDRVAPFNTRRKIDLQAAVCETLVAKYLRTCVDDVRPFEDSTSGGPDFVCWQRNLAFYVEATALATHAVEAASRIPDDPHWDGGAVGSLSAILRSSVSDKVRQCIRTDAPTIIAIGILHSWASMSVGSGLVRDMLVSDETYKPAISPAPLTPTKHGEFVTELATAMFMTAGDMGLVPLRQPVSAVLVFGFGVVPPNVVGIINTHARRPFAPNLLLICSPKSSPGGMRVFAGPDRPRRLRNGRQETHPRADHRQAA